MYSTYPDLYQKILTTYGFVPFRYPFLDAEFISRGIECWNRGIDVYIADPCDVLSRPHSYSPLWLRASFLTALRLPTTALGLVVDTAFILSLHALLRPTTWREALLLTLCCTSTMTAFAMERANVDVLLFVILVIATRVAPGTPWSRAAAYALILFAGLLKFYPIVALVLLLRERPRLFALYTALALAVLLAFVLAYRSELVAMGHNIPVGHPMSDLFGASNLPNGIALLAGGDAAVTAAADGAKLLTWVALLTAAATLATCWFRSAPLRHALASLPPSDEITLILGSVLVAGCFFTGQSIGYRGIDLIFVVAGLLALRRQASAKPCRRLLSSVTAAAALLMWEGLVRTWIGKHPSLLVFWLLRELLWWYLAAFLLAAVTAFVTQSTTVTTLARRLSAPAAAADHA